MNEDLDKADFLMREGAKVAAKILKVVKREKFTSQEAATIVAYAYGLVLGSLAGVTAENADRLLKEGMRVANMGTMRMLRELAKDPERDSKIDGFYRN